MPDHSVFFEWETSVLSRFRISARLVVLVSVMVVALAIAILAGLRTLSLSNDAFRVHYASWQMAGPLLASFS